jgi:integrase
MSKWHAVIDLPKRNDCKRRQVTRSFDTAGEAHAWLASMVTDRTRQESAQGPLMSDYLVEWLDGQVYLRPSTRASYRAHIEKYLIPAFGCNTVLEVSTPQVERFAHDLAARGLAAGTVQRVLATLRSAFGRAVRLGLIPANPASGIRVPGSVARPARTWTPQESADFLCSLGTDAASVLLRLALTTGMRRGELLGLRWSSVDLSQGRLRVEASRVSVAGVVVEGPPKSRNGLRTVYLDPHTVALLEGLRDASGASKPEDDGLVFVHDDGRPMTPWWVSRHFDQVIQRSGLPRIRFHDLRHSSATLGLAAGESLKEVSARLGHAGIAITADIYADVLPEFARRSTQRRVALMTGTRQEGTDVA